MAKTKIKAKKGKSNPDKSRIKKNPSKKKKKKITGRILPKKLRNLHLSCELEDIEESVTFVERRDSPDDLETNFIRKIQIDVKLKNCLPLLKYGAPIDQISPLRIDRLQFMIKKEQKINPFDPSIPISQKISLFETRIKTLDKDIKVSKDKKRLAQLRKLKTQAEKSLHQNQRLQKVRFSRELS